MKENPQRNGVGGIIERRTFLHSAGTGLASLYAASAAAADPQRAKEATGRPQPAVPGVITRQRHPLNAEFQFSTLNSFLTPNEQFYIRTHFETPDLQASQWSLRVEGHVERPFEVSLSELIEMQPRTLTATLECSGNSRVFLQPPQVSIRWEQGGVSTAEWTGVPLAALLKRAGVKSRAVEVILEGHDQGSFEEPNAKTPGAIHYARSIPLEKAQGPEVLLAHRMNGEELPPEHGYPMRAVVAGWYGMASVKWLRRIIVTDHPFQGYFQTFAYTIWERRHNGLPTLAPVRDMTVKAQIARPMLHEVVPAGSTFRIFGAAWSGDAEIEKVEVSANEGRSWSQAKLDQMSVPFAWRFFEHEWQVSKQPGPCTLMARATDSRGRVQPMQRDPDRRDAVINHVQPIEVYVAESGRTL